MSRSRPDPRLVLRLTRCAAALGAGVLLALASPPPTAGHEAGGAGGKGGEDEKWDVDEPRGPARTVPIDVDEGTWMSVDVAPDGRDIVFDLLGDLYTVPIEGGEARALTSGFAWDMQPRYSPDGRWIAFTSDRGGGDNVWVIGRDGTESEGAGPRQVTDESFRLLNSPSWSPDGRWIAARKHFTSQRSAGAGEIWLYHASGGRSGLQATERPNDQKDLGEPAFSPDGRFIYFSQDTTPGGIFEYNKDPNPGIYTIRRLDRESGEIVDLAGGAGGAIRPTPSPDGTRLAFIRRVRAATVLWVKDLESGAERPLWDGLDRDLQETWAIHGVYPQIAWTPDSAAVVAWAGGGIHRIDAATGEATEIPFRVRTERTVIEPLRYPVEVAPERFDVRMLRWVTVSPAGDRVVFQALGNLWVRDLPDGQPRRLTRDDPGAEQRFEHEPSFTRDGRWIVYTTWNDRELGDVRAVPAAGGTGRVLTAAPGHYRGPVVSPDGQWLVYRRDDGGGADGLLSTLYTGDPGIYRLPFRPTGGGGAGEPEEITPNGVQPHFGADPGRVYLLRFGEEERTLVSLEIDGSDERVHVEDENAGRFRVSPDGRWLAWQERYQAYVAPFPATGRTVELAPDSKALPVTRVSRDAGDWLGWSGDSAALHWSVGPDLHRLPLSAAFAFLEGEPPGQAPKESKPEEGEDDGDGAEDGEDADGNGADSEDGDDADDAEDEDPDEGEDDDDEAAAKEVYARAEVTPIGFEADTDRPAGTLALTGARIVTMAGDGGGVIEDGVIVVERDRIRAVGRRGEVEIPAGAHVVDASGKTIVPGLIDVHWHGPQASGGVIPQRNWVDHASLAFGVTTIHDPSSDTATVFAASEMARAGLILAPRIFSTGTILYGAETPFMVDVDSLEDARTHLRRMKAAGAFSVKSYNQPRRDQRQQVLAAARELEMMVVPEGGSLFQHNLTMVVDGHTGIEHALPLARVYDDVRQLWGATPVGYTPTLVVAYGGLWGENYWYATTDVWAHPRLSEFVPREALDARSRRRVLAPEEEWNHFAVARTAAELHDAGVPVQVGAHGQREGLAVHWEMWMLGQGGMTPLEALAAGTIDAARYLGLDGDLGSIEPGKLADLAILGGDPLADLRQTDTVERVVLGGRLYDAATLDRLWPDPEPRPPYWWERGDDGRLLLAPERQLKAPAAQRPGGGGLRAP